MAISIVKTINIKVKSAISKSMPIFFYVDTNKLLGKREENIFFYIHSLKLCTLRDLYAKMLSGYIYRG